jgi:hypothetical protein
MQWRLVEELSKSQVDDLVELYHHTYWASHRKHDDVAAMLKGTQYVFGVVEEDTGSCERSRAS